MWLSSPPPPSPGLMCVTRGSVCFWSLCFLSLLPSVLSAAITTVPTQGHMRPGEGERQDGFSPCLRHYFLPGALGLEPLSCPPTAGSLFVLRKPGPDAAVTLGEQAA